MDEKGVKTEAGKRRWSFITCKRETEDESIEKREEPNQKLNRITFTNAEEDEEGEKREEKEEKEEKIEFERDRAAKG